MFFCFYNCWNVVVFLKEMVENPAWSPRGLQVGNALFWGKDCFYFY